MARQVAIMTKTDVHFYRVGRDARPLTTIRKRLYDTSESNMVVDSAGSMELVLYDLDGTQPYGSGKRLDPDITMALIDSAKESGEKPTAKISGKWLNTLSKNFGVIIAAVMIGYFILSGGIDFGALFGGLLHV